MKKALVKLFTKVTYVSILMFTLVFSCYLMVKSNTINYTESEYSVETLSEAVINKEVVTRFDDQKESFVLAIECETSNNDIDEIINLLDKYNVKASFFVTGMWAEKYKDDIRLLESKGHDICCHGYTHLKLSTLDNGRVDEELTRFRALISDVVKKENWNGDNCFRAPYSEVDKNVLKIAGEKGYIVYNDEINALDWKNDITTLDVINNIKENLLPGDIVTIHSGHTKSSAVLTELLKYSNESNLSIKSITSILN